MTKLNKSQMQVIVVSPSY